MNLFILNKIPEKYQDIEFISYKIILNLVKNSENN